ncbi:MAG: ComEC/Rec2 family competence protein, partial [Caldilineales bacterium]|nr:ComEC/Rec2 family competence protein [Caldilineales bacterium]
MFLTRLPRPPSPYLPIYAALGVAAGVWLGERVLTGGSGFRCAGPALSPSPAWLWLGLPPLAGLAWRTRTRRRIAIPLLLLAALLLGFWRYLDHPFEPCPAPADLRSYHTASDYGRASVFEGVILGYPDRRATFAQYRVQVDAIWQGQRRAAIHGVALVRSGPDALFAYGDRVRIRGAAIAPPIFPDFDYRRFLARKGIHTLIRRAEITLIEPDQGAPFWAALYAFRARGSALLNQILPRPYSDLANGMILGIETGIDRDLYEQFNLTGTSHVIVISGSNIAIVSGILLALFTRVLRRRRLVTLLTLAGILLYTLLVGADAAVTRAALMGSLYVMAVGLGRQSAAIISLFFAGLVMLLLNPLTLWDVGFQLSFMATLGLILFNAPLRRRWDARIGKRLPPAANGLLAEGLLVTFAAQITTMPLVVAYFGRLSLISFLVNLLIIPVQPPIMIAGGMAVLAGLIWLPLAKVIALLPLASLWWTVFIVQQAAALPLASLEVSAFGRLIAVLYTGIFALGFLWWLIRQEQGASALIPPAWRPRLARAGLAAGLLILPLWGASAWAEAQPDGYLHLHLLGREQGAAWLIITPGGNRVLLDPGRG